MPLQWRGAGDGDESLNVGIVLCCFLGDDRAEAVPREDEFRAAQPLNDFFHVLDIIFEAHMSQALYAL